MKNQKEEVASVEDRTEKWWSGFEVVVGSSLEDYFSVTTMGSKKHKKHKESKKHRVDQEEGRQEIVMSSPSSSKPSLKLVLKVGGQSSSSPSRPTVAPLVIPAIQQLSVSEQQQQLMARNSASLAPPVVPQDYLAPPVQSMEVDQPTTSKKAKKKKSKKKHKKHHHHKCEHHHHHHKHHKHHRSDCPKSHSKKDKSDAVETKTVNAPLLSIAGQAGQLPTTTVPLITQVYPEMTFISQEAILEPPVVEGRDFSTKDSLKNESNRVFYTNFLNLIFKSIQKRDTQNFFAWPVTDTIAPAYSNFIKTPMDLSTIKKKIDHYAYENVYEMRSDVKLMCENAMTYNLADTVYFKAAKKLWYHCKEKIFAKEELLELRSQAEGMKDPMNPPPPSIAIMESPDLYAQYGLPVKKKKKEVATAAPQPDIFGFTPCPPKPPAVEPVVETVKKAEPVVVQPTIVTPTSTAEATTPSEPTVVYPSLDKILAIGVKKAEPEPSSEEEEDGSEEAEAARILAVAQKAASAAAEKLSLHKPNGVHYSCLRQKKDGSTTLSIIGANPPMDRYLKIDDLVGKLPEGTPFLPTFKEPESNKVRPIESRDVGPFGSYLPSLDSSRATLSKEESALILSVYGDEETGVPYAKSLMSFAGDSEYLIRMTDGLLDVLTQGQHSKEMKQFLKEHPIEEEKMEETAETAETKATSELDEKLGETQDIITALDQVQRKRLSSTTRPTTASSEEVHLAHLLTSKLTEVMSSFTTPVDVTDMKSIRKALGITLKNEVRVS